MLFVHSGLLRFFLFPLSPVHQSSLDDFQLFHSRQGKLRHGGGGSDGLETIMVVALAAFICRSCTLCIKAGHARASCSVPP